jgi:hypothetical protein
MKVWAPYESMEESAKLCPIEHNIKVLLRHSIRQDIEDKVNVKEAQLTREGNRIAERFGKELGYNIGTISSSFTQRCIDTCFAIISGYNKTHLEYKLGILQTKMLQDPHNIHIPESKETWEKLGMEGIFDCFAKNKEMPGIYDLRTSVNRMMSYVFETGNQKNTIDIFCTHDFQLAMLLLFINGKSYDYKQILFDGSDNWPFMLEGIFLWKNNDNIILSWRGKIKKI